MVQTNWTISTAWSSFLEQQWCVCACVCLYCQDIHKKSIKCLHDGELCLATFTKVTNRHVVSVNQLSCQKWIHLVVSDSLYWLKGTFKQVEVYHEDLSSDHITTVLHNSSQHTPGDHGITFFKNWSNLGCTIFVPTICFMSASRSLNSQRVSPQAKACPRECPLQMGEIDIVWNLWIYYKDIP